MKCVIQRVSQADVAVSGEIVGTINHGLLVLMGLGHEDTASTVQTIFDKIIKMRIFNDEAGKMNLSLLDVQGSLLIVSQFTLLANTSKGNRPAYVEAARPEVAKPLYEYAIKYSKSIIGNDKVANGIFGADMKISLINDGPVTIVI